MNHWAEGWKRIKQLQTSRVARNTGWVFAGEGARIGIQAIYFIVIARQLGSTGYGTFAAVLAMVSILSPFATWGWGSLLIKYVSRDRTTFRDYWGQTLCVGLLSGSLLCIVALTSSLLIFGNSIPWLLTLSVALSDLIFFRLVTLCGNAYQAHERLGRTAGLQVLVSTARLGAALFMAVSVTEGTAMRWGGLYCASTIMAAVVAFVLVSKDLGLPRFGIRIRWADLIEGFHFSVSLSSATAHNDVDKALLGRLAPFSAVGVYSVAYRLIDAAFLPVRSLLFATYARFFQQGRDGIEATVTLARRLVVPSVAYALVASAALVAVAPILPAILGADFDESVAAVRFLAAIPVLRSIQVFASDALTGAGHQHWRSSLQFVVAVGNIGLNLLLIPVFSWRGAAAASLLCDAGLAIGMWMLVWLAVRRAVDARTRLSMNVSGPLTGNA